MNDRTETTTDRGGLDLNDVTLADVLTHLAEQSIRVERRFAALEQEIATLKAQAATERQAA